MVRHILADGREVESIEGMVIPADGPTAAVYHIVAEILKKKPELAYKEKEANVNVTA